MKGAADFMISVRREDLRDAFFAFHRDVRRDVSIEDWYRFLAALVGTDDDEILSPRLTTLRDVFFTFEIDLQGDCTSQEWKRFREAVLEQSLTEVHALDPAVALQRLGDHGEQ